MVKVLPEPVTPSSTWSRSSASHAAHQFGDRGGLVAGRLVFRHHPEAGGSVGLAGCFCGMNSTGGDGRSRVWDMAKDGVFPSSRRGAGSSELEARRKPSPRVCGSPLRLLHGARRRIPRPVRPGAHPGAPACRRLQWKLPPGRKDVFVALAQLAALASTRAATCRPSAATRPRQGHRQSLCMNTCSSWAVNTETQEPRSSLADRQPVAAIALAATDLAPTLCRAPARAPIT